MQFFFLRLLMLLSFDVNIRSVPYGFQQFFPQESLYLQFLTRLLLHIITVLHCACVIWFSNDNFV